MKSQKTVSVFLLSVELLLALFVAGVAVPSLIYSGRTTNLGSPLHSARSLDIVGVTLIFNFWNIGSALMGALVGAVIALMLTSRVTSIKGLGQSLSALYPRKYMRPSLPA
jgi:prolipoprotein diacylglyceryltransferase